LRSARYTNFSVYSQHLTVLQFSKTELQNAKKANNDIRKELRLSQHAVQAAERLKLELEGVQDENANLQAQVAELQRGHADLKRQTEKWKKFETKNDQEAKARIDLEVAKGELEERVQELEMRDKESVRELKKLRSQVKTFEVRAGQFM
jgi:chromosome segregation ATPase